MWPNAVSRIARTDSNAIHRESEGEDEKGEPHAMAET